MNRSGSGSCTQPERDGGNSSIEQEPGRPGSPAPKALESGKTHRPKKATERLTRKPPQVEATIPTRRKTSQHCESKILQAETWGAEKRKTERFSILMLSEEWRSSPPGERRMAQKRRRGTTGTPVPMTRNGKEPVYSHNLQENSQDRFCQLDTTVTRRKRPVKRQRGLRQAPRGRGKRRSAQACRIHHAKESLEEARIDRREIPVDAQGIKGTRVAAACHSRRRGRQATTITAHDPSAAAEDRICQPKGQRGSGYPQKQAGTRWGASN